MTETRTFFNDPNPPPSAAGLTLVRPAESAPAPIPSPAPAPQAAEGVMKDNATAAETEGEYWLRDEEGGARRIFLKSLSGQNTEIGVVANPDVNTILEASGRRNAFGNWTIPKDVALSLKQGKLGFPEHLAAQYASGEASVRRGEIFSRALRDEMSFADAADYGELERQKMLSNERPDIAWKDAPFGRLVAEARWVAGAGVNILPFMKGAVSESAGGAAILGAGALSIAGTSGLAAPIAIPLVAGMMATGASYKIFKYTMDVEGGNVAGDMYTKGFPEKTIREFAPAAGAIIGALELTGMRFLTAPLKRQFVKNVLGSEPVKKVMANWLVNYTKELGGEVGVEVAQETVTQMTNQFAAVVDKRPELLNSKEDIWNALVQTAAGAAAGMAVIKLPGAAMDYAGSRQTKANARTVKTAIGAGEIDAKTVTVARLEGLISPEMDATKVNAALASPETAEAFGKKNADNEDVKAAVHAKSEALKIKYEAVTEGKPVTELDEAAQTEAIKISGQMNTLNSIGKGMDAAVNEEPMVPRKEAATPMERVERKYSEQSLVLKTLDKETKALNNEVSGLIEERDARLEEGKSVVALNAAINKLTGKILRNEEMGAEIVMTPMGADEALGQHLAESGAEATISAAELVRMEQTLVDKVANAKQVFFKHGEAYAKREVKQVQAYIQELVKRSNLPSEDKLKFTSILRNTQTVEQLEKNYPEIRDRIFAAEEIRRAKASEQILTKALKAGKAKKVDGKLVGKFGDADTQAIVTVVNAVNKMTRSQAEMETNVAEGALNEASDLSNPDYSPQNHAKAFYTLQAARFRSGQMSTEEGVTFVTDLTAMLAGARAKFLEEKIAEREARIAEENAGIEKMMGDIVPPEGWEKARVEPGSWAKGFKIPRAVIGAYEQGLGAIHSIGHLLAFRTGEARGQSWIEKMLSASKEETAFDGMKLKWHERLTETAQKAYSLSTEAAARKVQRELLIPHDLGTHKNAAGQTVHLIYTRDEAIKFFMELQDPSLSENITNPSALAYTPAMVNEVTKLLTEGDKRFALGQLGLYRELYKAVNKVFRAVRGVDLSFNNFYSPIQALGHGDKAGAEMGVTNAADQIHAKSTMGNWAISRVRHLRPLAKQSSLTAFNDHVYAVTRYIAYEKKVRQWNSLLANPKFKATVIGIYGDTVYSALRTTVERITKGSHERALMRGIDKLITRLIVAEIVGKPLAIAKQLTSMPAFANAVPTHHLPLFFKELVGTLKDRKFEAEWVNSDFVRSRGANLSQELKALLEAVKGGTKLDDPRVLETLGTFVKLGDKASVLLGGNALFRYLRSQGVSVEEAIDITSETARRTQSSGSIVDLSPLQGAGGLNRLFTAYLNQPVQFIRLEIETLTDMASKGFLKGEGRISRADAIKTLLLFHVVLPSLFQAVADFGWDEEKQKRAAILGSFNSVPLLASVITKAIHTLMAEEGAVMGAGSVWDSWGRDLDKAIKAMFDAEEPAEYFEALELLSNPAFKALWGIPTKPFFNIARGLSTMATGDKEDFLDAFKLVVGYSPYMIEEQTTRRD